MESFNTQKVITKLSKFGFLGLVFDILEIPTADLNYGWCLGNN